ncbi:MAG: hypothetical protein ACXADB_01945 [Candidatus Hermodarchaeia archaeon]|jgi:uncharacterized membrane protein
MSVRHERWENYSICGVFLLFLIILIFNPVIAILFIIIGFLSIGIVYLIRTPNREVSTELSASSLFPTNNEHEPQTHEPKQEQELKFSTKTHSEPETEKKVQELQQRIAELEDRIQILNEQLAKDPVPGVPIVFSDDFENEKTASEELSEKAIQHLLETLDEKLAKRSISEQLYTRLRDKYIARMEKSKKRREASAKRGVKDSNSGDT